MTQTEREGIDSLEPRTIGRLRGSAEEKSRPFAMPHSLLFRRRPSSPTFPRSAGQEPCPVGREGPSSQLSLPPNCQHRCSAFGGSIRVSSAFSRVANETMYSGMFVAKPKYPRDCCSPSVAREVQWGRGGDGGNGGAGWDPMGWEDGEGPGREEQTARQWLVGLPFRVWRGRQHGLHRAT
jgi:hypothetical protein